MKNHFAHFRIIVCTFRELLCELKCILYSLSVHFLCTSCALPVHFRILCDYWCALFVFCCALQNCMCFYSVHFFVFCCALQNLCDFAVHENVKEVTEHLLHLLHLSAQESSPMFLGSLMGAEERSYCCLRELLARVEVTCIASHARH